VAKVTINGEVFQWDFARKPLAEALALEEALKCRYVDWENDLQAGSAKAVAGFIWLVWRRNGRDVPIGDILSGAVEVDLGSIDTEADDGEADPTSPPPEPSDTTG
jgi:hypothetical protein